MKKLQVLIADDDSFICEDISLALDEKRFVIDTANNGNDAFELFQKKHHDIVISDIQMPNQDDGFILLDKIKNIAPETAVIIVTGFGDVQRAVRAMKLGAVDFITKPFEADQVAVKIDKIADRVELTLKNRRMREELNAHYEIIGESKSVQQLRAQIERIAATDSTVLIGGPNGTGKELVAWQIRNRSNRADKPFIIVNCAAIPEELIEAELFGNEAGAYTGAVKARKGKFELADGGTIFLDEIGDMSQSAQAKVLRVLQSGEISRVGSEKSVKVDVRVIAASNKDIQEMVRKNLFREDLYYRLNVLPVRTSSLEQRREDIPLLIEHFMRRKGLSVEAEQIFSPDALNYLKALEYPGNIRQLQNVVERLIIYYEGGGIDIGQVKLAAVDLNKATASVFDTSKTIKEATNDFEREFIRLVRDECDGNVAETAERLGLKRQYLYDKMKNLGIER
jgi:two-component system nitrogen regulation response regulator NtrX